MSALEPKDRFVIESACGWLMLGNPGEALREIAQLPAAVLQRAEVLMVLWDIHSQRRKWEEAIEVADRLLSQVPEQAEGYIKRAFALHELKRTQEAWDTLNPVLSRFEENWLIPYNLACYASQLGRREEALKLFRRALRLGGKRELREMALTDADLQPIRGEIDKLTSSE